MKECALSGVQRAVDPLCNMQEEWTSSVLIVKHRSDFSPTLNVHFACDEIFLIPPTFLIATMFNLPEIDDMVFRQLGRHELAQCARVSRMWHRMVIPYLWGDLTFLSRGSDTIRKAFCLMLLEDYQLKRQHGKVQKGRGMGQHGKVQKGRGMGQHVQAQPSPLSILEKYGPFVQVLPDPESVHFYFLHDLDIPRHVGRTQLTLYLFEHCPSAHIPYLSVEYDFLKSDDRWTMVVENTLSRVRYLDIVADTVSCPSLSSFPKLKDVLDKCSDALSTLDLAVQVPLDHEEEDDRNVEQREHESKEWRSLKELALFWCHDKSRSKTFWPWLWKRCCRIEKLRVDTIDSSILQSLAANIPTFMPNLNKICLGSGYVKGQHLSDHATASLLAGSRKGWKMVQAGSSCEFGKDAMETLTQHVSTLEELSVGACPGSAGNNLVQVLASAPRLHTLIFGGERPLDSMWPCFSADKFIDRDPNTGSLTVWACETSLKVLVAEIRGIPRPDLSGQGDFEDTCPGQGQGIQDLVYDRLARLIHLEALWLESRPYNKSLQIKEQHDCLELSLESGLYKLRGLKKLEELVVRGMATKIGVNEVQWMVEHWPRLRVIHGFDRVGEGKKAAEWLREHHPEIRLELPQHGPRKASR